MSKAEFDQAVKNKVPDIVRIPQKRMAEEDIEQLEDSAHNLQKKYKTKRQKRN